MVFEGVKSVFFTCCAVLSQD